MKNKHKKKKKFIVEVKTNSQGWQRAELVGTNNNGTVSIKLKSGDIIRKPVYKDVKYGKSSVIRKKFVEVSNKKELKMLRSKKKRKRRKKPNKKYRRINK